MPTIKKQRGKVSTNVQSKSKKNVKPSKAKTRSVLHSTVRVEHEEPITHSKAQELLGWQEEDPDDKKNQFGNNFMFKHNDRKVRCANNVTNRPLDTGTVLTLKQEILRKRWKLNGEPIIIGQTGLVLNGQHTLVALIAAVEEWRENPEAFPDWSDEPSIAKLIVYGITEDDHTVNTMDTCKPRSLADVIYRARYFKDLPAKDHKIASRMLDSAIRMLWNRTGSFANAFAVRRTHAESINFLERHPKLLDAVRHVYEEEDKTKRISKFLPAGYSAAALYLMAASETDPKKYYNSDIPCEELLNMDKWERATEFFVELAGESAALDPVRSAIKKMMQEEVRPTVWERWAVVARAWSPYSEEKPVTNKHVILEYEVKDDRRILAEHPLLGGIDVGEDGPTFSTNGDKNVEERKEQVRTKKFGKAKKAVRKGETWAKGDCAWVHSKSEDAYFAKLEDDPYQCVDNIERVMISCDGGEFEVAVMDLSLSKFER